VRILIADDDLASRTVLASVLEREGHEVETAANGAEAWHALQQPGAPALAILDWMMPEMDGLEVVRRVRARPTEWPPYLIMLTTKGEKADVIAGLEAGTNDYLAKPFDPGELRARVEVGRRMIEMQNALAAKVGELRQALEQVKTLRGIVPICSSCKKIRDDKGYWNQIEVYLGAHSDVEFSHGVCPECVRRLYGEYLDDPSEQVGK